MNDGDFLLFIERFRGKKAIAIIERPGDPDRPEIVGGILEEYSSEYDISVRIRVSRHLSSSIHIQIKTAFVCGDLQGVHLKGKSQGQEVSITFPD